MANEIIQTVPFDFNDIYQGLLNDIGADSLYEGSNLAQLITSMSYLVSMLNVNTAANINEMFLPLAKKRENVLEGARLLGYEPSHKKSYRYTIKASLKTTILLADKIVLEKYSKFSNGDNTYYYMGDSAIEIHGLSGTIFEFEVIEGDLKLFSSEPSLTTTIGNTLDSITGSLVPKTYIDVPFTDIEENGLEVYLTYTNEFGKQKVDEKWNKTSQFMIDNDTIFFKEFLRLDDIDFRTPRIYFKYANIGSSIQAGVVVRVNALVSKGASGEATGVFETSNITLSSKLDLTNFVLVAQGSEEESISSIQQNAPLFYNTANRVITTMDYESFCNRDSKIKTSLIWGGDEEYPERPGEIWFSMIPATVTRTFTPNTGKTEFLLAELNDAVNNFLEEVEIKSTTVDEEGNVTNPGIWDSLEKYKIPTMKFHNRHPVYLNCSFDISVLKYNLTVSRATINEAIFNIIDLFFKGSEISDGAGNLPENVEKFKSEFFNSSLIKRIDEYLSDASGFNIVMTNSVSVFEKNLTKESFDPLNPSLPLNLANMDIYFQFAKPFEDIFDGTGALLTARLPDISTLEFKANNTLGTLSVDWTPIVGNVQTHILITADILHTVGVTSTVVGKYMIFNGVRKNIVINLWAQDDTIEVIDPFTQIAHVPTGNYLTTTLRRTDFSTPQEISVKFFSPNFKTNKNVIPRLKRVSFI